MILGLNAKLYYLSSGTRAAWPGDGVGAAPENLTEITKARDVNLRLEKGEATATDRSAGGWEKVAATLKTAVIETDLTYETANAAVAALRDAFLNNTTIAIAALDGNKDTVGAEGLWADFEVLQFSRNEPLTDGLTVHVVLKPAYTSVNPEWVTVAT